MEEVSEAVEGPSGGRVGKVNTDLSDRSLVLMQGLPYAGKTPMAQSLGHPVVCPDAIRVALHGTRYRQDSEPVVWAIARTMVLGLFLAGHGTVVLDACSVSRKRRDEWRRDASWQVHVLEIPTPAETCRERAEAAGDEQILPILERMAGAYEPPQDDELRFPTPPPSKRRVTVDELEQILNRETP